MTRIFEHKEIDHSGATLCVRAYVGNDDTCYYAALSVDGVSQPVTEHFKGLTARQLLTERGMIEVKADDD